MWWKSIWNWLWSLPLWTENSGKIMVLGASRSGKSTLLKAAEVCFGRNDKNYSCENPNYQPSATDIERLDKWGSGRYILTIKGTRISFYTAGDYGGNRDYFLENLKTNLADTKTIFWCFDASRKDISCESQGMVSLKGYVGASVEMILAEMKKMREETPERLCVRNFILLGTHLDLLTPPPDRETLKRELGYDELVRKIKLFDENIKIAFFAGSFISYDSSRTFWDDIMGQLLEGK